VNELVGRWFQVKASQPNTPLVVSKCNTNMTNDYSWKPEIRMIDLFFVAVFILPQLLV